MNICELSPEEVAEWLAKMKQPLWLGMFVAIHRLYSTLRYDQFVSDKSSTYEKQRNASPFQIVYCFMRVLFQHPAT